MKKKIGVKEPFHVPDERPIVKYCKDCAHRNVCHDRMDEEHDCVDFLSGPTKDSENVRR